MTSQLKPVSWLGLNGNGDPQFTTEPDYWAQRGVAYDRFDCKQGMRSVQDAVARANRSVSLGMIPIVIIESAGYSNPGPLPTGDALTSYVNYFVSVAQAVQAAQPHVRSLFEVENEPWGTWFWLNPTPAAYGAEVAAVLAACQAAHIDLTRVYATLQNETWLTGMLTAAPALTGAQAPLGWSVHPYGSGTQLPPLFGDGQGIAWLPQLRSALPTGKWNILVSEFGLKNYPDPPTALTQSLLYARSCYVQGWLTGLVLYSRMDGGWSMQDQAGNLTPLGEALDAFPRLYKETVWFSSTGEWVF